MTWRQHLGLQIRSARRAAGITQLQLAEKISIKREHISNLELGKNSPAVKIVTEIAKALNTSFRLDGCLIAPSFEREQEHGPVLRPMQLALDLGIEYRFNTESVSLTARNDKEVELRAVLVGKKTA